MLLELRLRNVAVIESVTLPLADGLNVLSGETGAGKSLIVGALGLLLGERAAPDRVRRGADRASVEATFRLGERTAARAWLDAQGIDVDEDLLILKREVAAGGRSRAWVNGSPVTVAQLRALGALLVVIHGQHEAQALLDPALQRETLDAFAGALELARAVAEAHERVRAARAARAELEARRAEAARRADYLRFVVEEIDAARLRVGEEEELDAEHRRLAHAEELRALSADAAAALHGGHGAVLERLAPVRRALAQLQRIDPTRDGWPVSLDGAYLALEELSRELTHYAETLDVDPARLRDVEMRRALITQLLRKHGPTVADVLATAASARTELSLVDDIEAARAQADAELAAAVSAHAEVTRALSARRRESAAQLSRGVSPLLDELGMAGGRFDVDLAPLDEAGAYGAERIQFRVALNAGLAAGALDRVASGGELSRVMLALSTVLASAQTVTTLIFDEVDAGVGGSVAWQVGALMRRVARHHQVLAISHLAQIAACAHHHIVVRKAASDGWTTADTGVLTGDDRVVELARMLGGDAERAVSRAHARELLERGVALDVGEEMSMANATDQPSDAATADLIDGRAAARPNRQRRGKRG